MPALPIRISLGSTPPAIEGIIVLCGMMAIAWEGDVSESYLVAEKRSYRDASRVLDILASGVSAAMLIAAAALYSPGEGVSPAGVLDPAAILLFAMALLTGLRKVEQTVMVLGTSFTILESEMNARGGDIGADVGNLDELRQAVHIISLKAAKAHRARNWFLAVGILVFVAARVMAAFSTAGVV